MIKYFNDEKIQYRYGSTGIHEQQRLVESFHRTLGKWVHNQQRNNKSTDWSLVLESLILTIQFIVELNKNQ